MRQEGRIGALVHASEIGLGVLGRAFWDHGVIDEVLIQPIRRHAIHRNWYNQAPIATPDHYETFLANIDALLILETVFDWDLVVQARRRGIAIVMMPMYEWSPNPLPVIPDRFACPSLLDLDYFSTVAPSRFLPVPVEVPWRQRERAQVFVHNAGNAESCIRNGTLEFLQAIPQVNADVQFVLRRQRSKPNARTEAAIDRQLAPLLAAANEDQRFRLVDETLPYEALWVEGDAFVFPEQFNGLSLPLQEARAAGMLVIAGDRYPINTWLPREALIPVSEFQQIRLKVELPRAVYRAQDIAATIDRWAHADIREYSRAGRQWAQEHSWELWAHTYRQYILHG